MSAPQTLTAAIVRKAMPTETEYNLYDAKQPGLFLRVQPFGAKSWCIRVGAKRVTLCAAGEVTLRDVRGEARALLRREDRGRGEARSTAITFAKLTSDFLVAAETRYAPTTIPPLNSYINSQLLPTFGAIHLDRFKPSDIAKWFFAYSRVSPGGANAALGHFRSMMSFARDHGFIDYALPDPTAPIKLNTRRSRGQLLNAAQLHRLGKTLSSPPIRTGEAARAIRLTLLTGCRPYEIARLRWDDVGHDRMHLPRTKTGPRDVILSKEAMIYLDRLQGRRHGKKVFPLLKADTKNRVFREMWEKIRARADLPDTFRLHDLRHTFASQAIMSGETLAATGAMLGHSDPESTEKYAHLDGAHLVEAVEGVAGTVGGLLEGVLD